MTAVSARAADNALCGDFAVACIEPFLETYQLMGLTRFNQFALERYYPMPPSVSMGNRNPCFDSRRRVREHNVFPKNEASPNKAQYVGVSS
jgi:hypothetical protein